MLAVIVVLMAKNVLWNKGEVEVKYGFRDKGRVHGGRLLLNEFIFEWARMEAS